MELIKSYLKNPQRYPNNWWDIFGVLVAFGGLSYVASESVAGWLDAKIFKENVAIYRIAITATLTALLYIPFDLLIYVKKRGFAKRIEEEQRGLTIRTEAESNTYVRENLAREDCAVVRIFASGGDDAKQQILALTKESFKPQKNIEIKVILRSDKNSQRTKSLNALVARWKTDIDEATSVRKCGYKFNTSFSTHTQTVMLRGYIFGEEVAALSWYARDDGKIRSDPKMPHILITSSNAQENILIEQAIKTFEYLFASGKTL